MTNKEAIKQIEWVKKRISNVTYSPESFEALNLAIKALEEQERPTGEWIMNKTSPRGRNYTCTHCKKISRNKFEYCPKCGADMREAEND